MYKSQSYPRRPWTKGQSNHDNYHARFHTMPLATRSIRCCIMVGIIVLLGFTLHAGMFSRGPCLVSLDLDNESIEAENRLQGDRTDKVPVYEDL